METTRILRKTELPAPNLTRAEAQALKNLKKRDDIVIIPADKGNATVVMNAGDYKTKLMAIHQERSYKELKKDPTSAYDRKTNLLIKKAQLPSERARRLKQDLSTAPRIYGLPKIHKAGVPLRKYFKKPKFW